MLLTIGHGADTADGFAARCSRNAVARIVDVRTAPGSRLHPQFGRTEMERWLPEAGVAYRGEKALGGFRKPLPDSLNGGLQHPSFRGYADYMSASEFHAALAAVLLEAATSTTAVMCSETLWWRCHRRLIADAATLLHGVEVVHIDGRGGTEPHRVTGEARVIDGVLRYPAVTDARLLEGR